MTPQVLTVLAGTSGIIGLLAVISYFYYSYRIREIESSERSIRQVVEGEGLFNADQILQILREFKDDPTRLEALKTFANINNQTAERVYSKIKNNVDLVQLGTQTAKSRRQLSLRTAVVFVVIALVALVYALVSHSGTPGDGRPSPSPSATVVVTPSPLLPPAVTASGQTPTPTPTAAPTATPSAAPTAGAVAAATPPSAPIPTATPTVTPTPTATPKAPPTSEDQNLQAKFDELLKQAANAEADGNWKDAADKYRLASELRPDDQRISSALSPIPEIKGKLERARYLSRFSVPKGLDLVVFSACDDDGAVERIYRLLQRVFPTVLLDSKKCLQIGKKGDANNPGDWGFEFPMVRSRIYFLGGGNADAARFLDEWLPGDQKVVDYNAQDRWWKDFYKGTPLTKKHLAEFFNPGALPDSPSPGDYMFHIWPDRALALFVGSDYEAIEIFLNAWIEERPLKEDETNKINKIEAKQQTEWSQLLKTWEQRKNEWLDNQLVEAARQRYGFTKDWKASHVQRFIDHLHVDFSSNAGLMESCDYYWPTH